MTGIAKLTLNGVEILVKNDESVDIPIGKAHRAGNPDAPGTFIFSEVQPGII